jgi:hypothetical protein
MRRCGIKASMQKICVGGEQGEVRVWFWTRAQALIKNAV